MSAYGPYAPRRGGGGCGKALGIACGTGCLLLVVGGILTYLYVVPRVQTALRPVFQTAQDVGTVVQRMSTAWSAIQKYHQDKGRYPDSLPALVPNYVPTSDSLRYPSGPGGTQFTYHKPTKDASPATVVLECDTVTLRLGSAPPQPVPIRVFVNGEVQAGTQTYRHEGGRMRPVNRE